MDLLYLILIVLLVIIDSYLIQNYATEKSSSIAMNQHGLETIVPVYSVKPFQAVVIVAVSLLFFLSIVVTISGIVIVNPGERGVVFNVFKGLSTNVLGEGLNIVIPVINRTFIYDVRRQEYTMSGVKGEGSKSTEDDSLWAPTREGLQVGIDLTCWFRIDPAKVHILHQGIGRGYIDNTVRPTIRSTVRMVISGYSIMDVYSEKREEIQKLAFKNLKEKLGKDNIIIEEILFRDIRFPSEFTKAIEEKQVAQQSAERMNYILDKERKEKERKVIEAEGQAQSIKIISDALLKNNFYLEYLKVNKLVDNIKVMVVPSGTNTLIDMKSIDQQNIDRTGTLTVPGAPAGK